MQRPGPETVLGDFSGVSLDFGGITTRFYREAGEHRVETMGPDGDPQDYAIAYTFGFKPLQHRFERHPRRSCARFGADQAGVQPAPQPHLHQITGLQIRNIAGVVTQEPAFSASFHPNAHRVCHLSSIASAKWQITIVLPLK